MKGLIMCGGSGTRLWPLSTATTPKQFLRLVDPERSMFQMTCLLAVEAGATEVIIVLNERFVALVEQQLSEIASLIPSWRLVREPVSRNTAPAIAAGILGEADDEIITVMPSDHVWDNKAFVSVVRDAASLADSLATIVTVGIQPTYPETGYGYIEKGETGGRVTMVNAFREKPDLATAQDYLASGKHLWNAGVFVFKKSTMISEMQRLCPTVLEIVEKSLGNDGLLAAEIFADAEDVSIDYAVLEHTKSCHVVSYESSWSDIGSYRTLQDISEKDEAGNTLKGNVRQLHTDNTMVVSHDPDIRFNLLGVSDLIVVYSPDLQEVLITTPDHCQDVKKLTQL